MKNDFFTIKQSSFMRALLYSHLANIVFGFIVFAVTHWWLKFPTENAVIATIAGTVVSSLLVSVIGTRRLSLPLTVMHQELNKLHEKINESNSTISTINQTSQALLEDLPLGFMVFNKKTELIRSNKYANTLLGVTGGNGPSTQQVLAILKELRSNGTNVNFIDWLHQAKTQKIQDLKRWPMVILRQDEKTVVCDVLVHYNKQDTNDNELVILLIDRSEEYERQDKQMEFISLAAHEIRGPITIMRGLIDILQDELGATFSDEHRELTMRMAVSARQLAGYVDNILNVSRVDRDSFEVHASEATWDVLIVEAAKDLDIQARAHHRKLEVRIPKGLPTVAVDPTSILHVLNNLIDNAIKYSPENGNIIVSAKLKENFIETTIQDFGMGIPANVVDNLFTKFYRSHRSKQRVNGTGLGLYLCKAIVEAHGGNIWVRSTEGAGTTFGFTLPTYASVADQLKAGDNEVNGIMRGSHGWIKNHALYRR